MIETLLFIGFLLVAYGVSRIFFAVWRLIERDDMISSFKFDLGEGARLESGESGTVIARAQYLDGEPSYQLRYVDAAGRMSEVWWTESALTLVGLATERTDGAL